MDKPLEAKTLLNSTPSQDFESSFKSETATEDTEGTFRETTKSLKKSPPLALASKEPRLRRLALTLQSNQLKSLAESPNVAALREHVLQSTLSNIQQLHAEARFKLWTEMCSTRAQARSTEYS